MKIYQQPVTEIEKTTTCYCPILAGSDRSSGDVGGQITTRVGLPIFGEALADPGFNSNSHFNKQSVWQEAEEGEDVALFD